MEPWWCSRSARRTRSRPGWPSAAWARRAAGCSASCSTARRCAVSVRSSTATATVATPRATPRTAPRAHTVPASARSRWPRPAPGPGELRAVKWDAHRWGTVLVVVLAVLDVVVLAVAYRAHHGTLPPWQVEEPSYHMAPDGTDTSDTVDDGS